MLDVLLFTHAGNYLYNVTVSWRNVDRRLTPQENLRKMLFEQVRVLFDASHDGQTAFCENVPGEDDPVLIRLGENEKPIEAEAELNWGLMHTVTVDVWSISGLWIRSSRLRWEPQDGENADTTFRRCLGKQLPELLNESAPPGHVLTCEVHSRRNQVLRVAPKR